MPTFKNWREKLGYSLHTAARELGETEARVRRFDSGEKEVDRRTLLAMEALEARFDQGVLAVPAMGSVPRRKGGAKSDGIEPLSGDTWAPATARLIMPILTGDLQIRTYGELHDEVVAAGGKPDIGTMQKYSYPLGRVGEAVLLVGEELGKPVPPIEALVVNKSTRMPGPGINYFLKEYLLAVGRDEDARDLKKEWRRARIIEAIHADIERYKGWKKVLKLAGL